MEQMQQHDLLELTADLAVCLLTSGAEIYRVEESVRRIFDAYEAGPCEVFAIPSLLIVSLPRPGQEPLTQIRRLGEQTIDLERVRACNDLCRRICKEKPGYAAARQKLTVVENSPVYPRWMITCAYGFVGFGFTLMFGGDLLSCCAAFLCGMAVEIALRVLGRFGTNSFFSTILASFCIATVACLFGLVCPGLMRDKAIIGALMLLVPGISLTNSMRDIMAGDLMAGSTRLILVLLSAGGLALGSGAALALFGCLGVM